MKKIQTLKEELKVLATDITSLKNTYKDGQRKLSTFDKDHPNALSEWRSPESRQRNDLRWSLPQRPEYAMIEYRYKHVAYCMLRGTPYELIESKVNEGNEIDMKKVQKIMQEYTDVE